MNTRDISVAVKRARYLWVQMEVSDYTMKNMDENIQDDNHGRHLLKKLLVSDIKSAEKSYFDDCNEESSLDSFLMELSSKERQLLNEQIENWNALPQRLKDEEIDKLKDELGLKDRTYQ